MQYINGKEIRSFSGEFHKSIYENKVLENCHFVNCQMWVTNTIDRRPLIKNIELVKCELTKCSLGPAIVENMIITDMKINGSFQSWGAVFNQVVLRGNIGPLIISPYIHPSLASPTQQVDCDRANLDYYNKVDWALDISNAEFTYCDIRCIPSQKIKRDPETQVIIKRTKAAEGSWRDLDLSGTSWPAALELFLFERNEPELLLIAPKKNPKFEIFREGIEKLRKFGIIEPG